MKKILLSVVALLLTSTVLAQEIEKKHSLQGEVSTPLSALRLASGLVKYGYAQQSALPLIQALQIINDNPTQPLKADYEGEKTDTAPSEGKSTIVSFDHEKVLAEAKKFAEGDETLLMLIEQIELENEGGLRGAVNGPSRTIQSVRGNSTDTYKISFIGEYLAEIAVSGDGDTDLDLYVYDSNGNLIAKDDDYTDDCYVRWVPAWTGKFIVKVVNRGSLYNRYVLLTN